MGTQRPGRRPTGRARGPVLVTAQPAASAPDPAAALQRIRRNCATIRHRIPQASWDLAVIETTAAAALEHGCRPADVTVIRGRLHDMLSCLAALSEELDNISTSAAQL